MEEKYEIWACDMDAGISDTGHQVYDDIDHTGTCGFWFRVCVKDTEQDAREVCRALRHGYFLHGKEPTPGAEYINGYPKDPMHAPATHAPDGRA